VATKRKRRRKHRGTQAGTIETPGRTRKPQTKEEARQVARQRRRERLETPPTWRGAMTRAAIAAAIFGVIAVLVLDREPLQGIFLAVFAFAVYVPMSYWTDRLLYKRRQRQKERGKESGRARAAK
jgi:Flp pilus assembly protein TadB